jgi:hypothetical protein
MLLVPAQRPNVATSHCQKRKAMQFSFVSQSILKKLDPSRRKNEIKQREARYFP